MHKVCCCLVALVMGVVNLDAVAQSPLRTMYSWHALKYNGTTYRNGIPIDVGIHVKNNQTTTFVTIPKWQKDVPFSLAKLDSQAPEEDPTLQPYPNSEMHRTDFGCSAIISAFRFIIDCDYMWVIDSGISGGFQECPPKLLLFNLMNDTLVTSYTFPDDVYVPNASLFINLALGPQTLGECLIYIADTSYHGLVVYNHTGQTSWRVENRFMYPAPDCGKPTINGDTFYIMDGIFSIVVDNAFLYFHPLASVREYRVSLAVLNNSTIWKNNKEAVPEQFCMLWQRSSQCAASAIDHKGNIYCVTFRPIQLTKWNVNNVKRGDHVVYRDEERLQFVSGMKMNGNSLLLLSNRFQKVAAGTQKQSEINYRIMSYDLGGN